MGLLFALVLDNGEFLISSEIADALTGAGSSQRCLVSFDLSSERSPNTLTERSLLTPSVQLGPSELQDL